MTDAAVTRRSVLLVEDDKSTRQVLTKYLVRCGYQVIAVDAAERVPPARQQFGRPFDVVVSDVHLPGMSGIDLASLMLAATPTQPIVLITGDPDEALAREALSRGPVSYLLKPFQPFELEAAITHALAVREQRREPPPAQPPAEQLIGGIPADWLRWVDERSYAGVGHAERLARICRVLLERLPEVKIDAAHLDMAAYCHELGVMTGGVGDPIELAWHGADLLSDLGGEPAVVGMIRHMHERWDGSGGPDQLIGAQIPDGAAILAVADSLDHYTAAWIQAGMAPLDALDRAIGLVMVQQETVFSPAVVRAMAQERSALRDICAVRRVPPAPSAETPHPTARIYPTIADATARLVS